MISLFHRGHCKNELFRWAWDRMGRHISDGFISDFLERRSDGHEWVHRVRAYLREVLRDGTRWVITMIVLLIRFSDALLAELGAVRRPTNMHETPKIGRAHV